MPELTKAMLAKMQSRKSALSAQTIDAIRTLRLRYHDIMALKGLPYREGDRPKDPYRKVMAKALRSFITDDNPPLEYRDVRDRQTGEVRYRIQFSTPHVRIK